MGGVLVIGVGGWRGDLSGCWWSNHDQGEWDTGVLGLGGT